MAELRELSSAIVPDAFSSGQRFFTDASRNLLTGLCLLAIADERIPDGARNLSTVLALLEPRDGKSAVKSLEELAADLPAGNPARQFLLVASSNGGGGEALVSTARNYLMSFCDDDVSRMLWDGEVDLASVGRKPTILYIASATDRGDRGALVSCIFSQALSALRETARLSGGRLPAETLLAIDEGSGIPKIPASSAISRRSAASACTSSSCSRTPACSRPGAATPGQSRTRCWRCSAPRSSSR